MSALEKIKSLFQDPPPEFVFEITADGIAMSRTRLALEDQPVVQHASLPGGVIVPSPVKDNILEPAIFAAAVSKLVPPASGRGRRGAALILPDNCIRIAVVDFESLPEKEEDRRALIKFRLRKTLPFDIDEAALSYYVQAGNKVIAAIAPVEIVARYEAPFRVSGLHPGVATSSSLALLDLLPATGSLLVALRSPGALTVLAVLNGVLTLARSLELTPDERDPLDEISADLYPTLVYLEDQTGARPAKLIIAGFGPETDVSATRLSVELDIPTESLYEPHPGLSGYLKSLNSGGKTAARTTAKTASKAGATKKVAA